MIRDPSYRGVVLEGFREEMIDHICSAVEAEMQKGAPSREPLRVTL